jgi:hypothetical protein
MTKEQENRIIDLQAKNTLLWSTWTALAIAGGIAGVVYASSKGKNRIGWFIVGSVAVSLPVGLFVRPKIIKNAAEIIKINNSEEPTDQKTTQEQKQPSSAQILNETSEKRKIEAAKIAALAGILQNLPKRERHKLFASNLTADKAKTFNQLPDAKKDEIIKGMMQAQLMAVGAPLT